MPSIILKFTDSLLKQVHLTTTLCYIKAYLSLEYGKFARAGRIMGEEEILLQIPSIVLNSAHQPRFTARSKMRTLLVSLIFGRQESSKIRRLFNRKISEIFNFKSTNRNRDKKNLKPSIWYFWRPDIKLNISMNQKYVSKCIFPLSTKD